jgi:aminoglycoside/choline kinase family phosphotransferase
MIELDEKKAREFLAKNEIENCEIKKVAGDASFRSYYRIFFGEKTYILMFAPPTHEDIKPFVKIDELLVFNNFSAPKIFARDDEFGFLLLEDFGDDTYTKLLKRDISQEFSLYKNACDCLLGLSKIEFSQDIQIYNHALLFREVMLFVDWYLPLQKKQMNLEDRSKFKSLWFQVFDQLAQFKSLRNHLEKNEEPVLVLRDYHADNLMSLPDREGIKKVALLDFQDAVIGSRAYDLVSLLEDARRDIDNKNRAKLFEYFLQNLDCNQDDFKNDYEILSLQRNIKILGIFARLTLRDGKNSYLDYMPRVLNFVRLRLESSNPILLEISSLIKKFI